MKESPIFTRTYDLLLWLIPRTLKFPRSQRFVMAEAVQRTALEFQEQLLEASLMAHSYTSLKQADISLAKLRLYLRLCHDLQLLSTGQYRHAAGMVTEVGRLLGAWLKTSSDQTDR